MTVRAVRWPVCAVLAAVAAAVSTAGLGADIVRRGPSNCADVALTFDLCPVSAGSGFDRALVSELEDQRIPATFFLSGAWIATHDREVRELVAVPFFELGTHGDQHRHLPRLDVADQRAEMLAPVRDLETRYHRRTDLFRPPYGEYTSESVRIAEAAGLKVVLWSVVSGDPDPSLPATRILDDVERRLAPGSVVIFHANGRGWHTSEIVLSLSQWMSAKHAWHAVTLTTLLAGCGASHATPTPHPAVSRTRS